jgi:hypothetical protein
MNNPHPPNDPDGHPFLEKLDEDLLEQIERDLDRSLGQGAAAEPSEPLPESAASGGASTAGAALADGGTSAGAAAGDALAAGKTPWRRHVKSVLRPWMCIAAAVLLVGTSLGLVGPRLKSSPRKTGAVREIKRAITIPRHEHNAQFLILAESGARKDLIELEVQLSFLQPEGRDELPIAPLRLNDMVYQYLLGQRPPENTYRHWSKIIQEKMPEYLRQGLPGVHLEEVRVTHFNRL